MQPSPQPDEPRPPSAFEELRDDPSSRKRFLKAVGGAGAASALGAFLAACGTGKPPVTPGGSNPNTAAGVGTDKYGKGDLGIARFAVTLEYVEVDFYKQAIASGKLSGRPLDLFKRFAATEQQHVAALEGAIGKLGGKPPLRPRAQYALQTKQAILKQALDLESLGVAAYLGQVDRIADKQLLAAALAIHSVEGRHTAAIATLLGQDPTPQGAFAQPAFASDVGNQLHSLTAPG